MNGMVVLSKIKPHSDAIDYFKELPFCNKPIEKPKVKQLKNIGRLVELLRQKQIKSLEDMQCHIKLK